MPTVYRKVTSLNSYMEILIRTASYSILFLVWHLVRHLIQRNERRRLGASGLPKVHVKRTKPLDP